MVRSSKSSRKKSLEKEIVVPSFVRKTVGCKYRDVEYSRDDKQIMVLAETEVRVIDAKTGRLSTTLQGHESRITSVALSWSNHLQVITSSTDGTLRIWDVEDGACLKVLNLGSDVSVQRVVTTSMDPSHCYALLTKNKEWEVVQIKYSIHSASDSDDDDDKEERVVLARGKVEASKKKKDEKKRKKKKYPKITTSGRYLCVVDREQMEVFDVVAGCLAVSYVFEI